jgi:hypothetical protein
MLRVLSLGAGVQSSTLYLMAVRGEFGDERPSVAIFADTGWEPAAVYRWLDWLEAQGREIIPVRRVSAGNIRENTLDRSRRNAQPPFYVRSPNASRETMIRRQCTKGYKIEPIWKEVRALLGLAPRQRAPRSPAVEQWMGISMDEVVRMKDSPLPWISHRWPLVERQMDRRACLRWMASHGYPAPPKSACIGCPFHSDAQWREMRDSDPESWADAVAFDALPRCGVRGIRGEPYLHRSLRPLEEVDFSTPEERGQGNLFGDGFAEECEGLCGV